MRVPALQFIFFSWNSFLSLRQTYLPAAPGQSAGIIPRFHCKVNRSSAGVCLNL
jgi:hypothetical protein